MLQRRMKSILIVLLALALGSGAFSVKAGGEDGEKSVVREAFLVCSSPTSTQAEISQTISSLSAHLDSQKKEAVKILALRAACYQAVDDYSLAIKDYNKILGRNGSPSTFLLERASAYFEIEAYEKVIKDIIEYYQNNPKSFRTEALLGKSYFYLSNYNKAVNHLQRSFSVLVARDGCPDGSVDCYSPEMVEVAEYLMKSLTSQGECQQLRDFEKQLKADHPGVSARVDDSECGTNVGVNDEKEKSGR